jgi:hypothetical protein
MFVVAEVRGVPIRKMRLVRRFEKMADRQDPKDAQRH